MIETLAYANRSGWGWNVHLARLPSGGLFVYSPAWLGDDTFAQIEKHGTPEVLFAPNHVHHISLEKYRQRWPKAVACASKRALKRLGQQGHPGMVDAAEAPLPAGARLLATEGTNSGETILSVDGEWITADAFCNFEKRVTGVTGAVLRLLQVSTGGISVGRLFEWFVCKDPRRYCAWLQEQVDAEKPKKIYFSHGVPASGPDVGARLVAEAKRRLL